MEGISIRQSVTGGHEMAPSTPTAPPLAPLVAEKERLKSIKMHMTYQHKIQRG